MFFFLSELGHHQFSRGRFHVASGKHCKVVWCPCSAFGMIWDNYRQLTCPILQDVYKCLISIYIDFRLSQLWAMNKHHGCFGGHIIIDFPVSHWFVLCCLWSPYGNRNPWLFTLFVGLFVLESKPSSRCPMMLPQVFLQMPSLLEWFQS